MTYVSFDRSWFLTWTTYGTWTPGDERGFVSPKFEGVPERRNNVVGAAYDTGRPELAELSRSKLTGPPIWLTKDQAVQVAAQFIKTAAYRGWTIVAGAVMANHVHLLVGVFGDPKPQYLMRDFKSYGSRALNEMFGKPESETWWTEQGSKKKIKDEEHFQAVVAYILNQANPLVVWQAGEGFGEREEGKNTGG